MHQHNSFIHRIDGKILINGVDIPLNVLLVFDPTYCLPPGIKSIKYTYDPETKTGYHFRHDGARNHKHEHPYAQLDAYITNLQGIQVIKQTLEAETKEIDDLIDSVIKPYTEKRQEKYPAIQDLVVALWELVVEGNSAAVNKLQSDRLHTKEKFPNPTLIKRRS